VKIDFVTVGSLQKPELAESIEVLHGPQSAGPHGASPVSASGAYDLAAAVARA
jgi:hypothetical protein